VPAAGQAAAGLEGLVGHCVNMLPLKSRLARGDKFADHVAASRRTMLDAYDHQDVTFGRVLQVLPVARDPSRLPLINVIFNIDQALSGEGNSMPGVALELASNARGHETFELFINAADGGAAGMRLECQYNADLFDAATVRRWLASYEVLLRSAVADPARALGKLAVLCDADRRAAAWNRTEVDTRSTRQQLIGHRAARPTASRQLPRPARPRASRRARHHRQCCGARVAGDRVGRFVERDLDLFGRRPACRLCCLIRRS
jgi:non-ribosomal peptide synthetase component F